MQKATYYDNSGLFGGYTYSKSDSYAYGPAHQAYPTSSIENEYQGPICSVQSTTVRPPVHKNSDINGSCMRPNGNQGSQPESVGDQQQAPPLAATSPNSSNTTTQKKKSPSNNGSNTATSVITKQIFPWMKETRQNSKQKSTNCTTPGIAYVNMYLSMCVHSMGWLF